MSLKDDLIAAKALIDMPEKWAENGSKRYVAGKMCAIDAISNVPHPDSVEAMRHALIEQIPNHSHGLLAFYNDDPSTEHADIMSLFDRAIEASA